MRQCISSSSAAHSWTPPITTLPPRSFYARARDYLTSAAARSESLENLLVSRRYSHQHEQRTSERRTLGSSRTPLPPEPPKPKGGKPRVDDRAALTGIVFVLRAASCGRCSRKRWTACITGAYPKSAGRVGEVKYPKQFHASSCPPTFGLREEPFEPILRARYFQAILASMSDPNNYR